MLLYKSINIALFINPKEKSMPRNLTRERAQRSLTPADDMPRYTFMDTFLSKEYSIRRIVMWLGFGTVLVAAYAVHMTH